MHNHAHTISGVKRPSTIVNLRAPAKPITEMSINDLKYIITKYKELIKEKTGEEFPQDPWSSFRPPAMPSSIME